MGNMMVLTQGHNGQRCSEILSIASCPHGQMLPKSVSQENLNVDNFLLIPLFLCNFILESLQVSFVCCARGNYYFFRKPPELSLLSGCPIRDYISQTPLWLAVVM